MANRLAALTSSAIGVLLLLGCLRGPSQGQKDLPPESPVPISTEAAQRFADKIEGLTGSDFVIEVSEQEVTSYVALRLADAVPLASPQVRFRPGKILLAGDLTTPVQMHVTLTGAIRVVDGRPEIEFQQGTAAGIRIPRLLLSSLSDTVVELMNESQGQLEVRHLDVTDGHLRAEGRIRQP